MRSSTLGTAAVFVLFGMGVSACGGPPDDASKQDFCAVIDDIRDFEDFDEAVDLYRELEDVGTPADIGEDARDGFEITVDAVLAADDRDDVEQAYDDLSQSDRDKADAFTDYANDTCREDVPAAEVP